MDDKNEEHEINLDSPFVEDPSEGAQEPVELTEEEGSITISGEDDDSITLVEQEQEHKEAALEDMRREVNLLGDLVSRNPNAAKFANCIESAFDLDIDFELAWNFIVKRLQYAAALDESVITLDENRLRSLQNDLQKIRRVNSLVNLMRALGVFTIEDKLVDALIAKEFGIPTGEQTNKLKDIASKFEKLLKEYADKISNVKM